MSHSGKPKMRLDYVTLLKSALFQRSMTLNLVMPVIGLPPFTLVYLVRTNFYMHSVITGFSIDFSATN